MQVFLMQTPEWPIDQFRWLAIPVTHKTLCHPINPPFRHTRLTRPLTPSHPPYQPPINPSSHPPANAPYQNTL